MFYRRYIWNTLIVPLIRFSGQSDGSRLQMLPMTSQEYGETHWRLWEDLERVLDGALLSPSQSLSTPDLAAFILTPIIQNEGLVVHACPFL